jgi:hypothetical protein
MVNWTKGTEVTLELAGLPPVTFSLEDDGAPPNPVVAALRPRFTLRRNGVVLLSQAPYGSPEEGVPWGLVLAGVLFVGALYVIAD